MNNKKSKPLSIHKLWMEIELAYMHGSYNDFVQQYVPEGTDHIADRSLISSANPINCIICPEYYPRQVEFMIPFMSKDKLYEQVNNISRNMAWTWNEIFSLEQEAPEYVGTHIHMWFKDVKDIVPNIKFRTLSIVLKHIYGMFETDVKAFKKLDDQRRKYLKLSLNRVIRNHNIWLFADKRFFNWAIRHNMEKIAGIKYAMTNGVDKRKYQPMLWSWLKSTWGKCVKPVTLEIRVIPNYMISYHPTKFAAMMDEIAAHINESTTIKSSTSKTNCVEWHAKLCGLWPIINPKKEKIDVRDMFVPSPTGWLWRNPNRITWDRGGAQWILMWGRSPIWRWWRIWCKSSWANSVHLPEQIDATRTDSRTSNGDLVLGNLANIRGDRFGEDPLMYALSNQLLKAHDSFIYRLDAKCILHIRNGNLKTIFVKSDDTYYNASMLSWILGVSEEYIERRAHRLSVEDYGQLLSWIAHARFSAINPNNHFNDTNREPVTRFIQKLIKIWTTIVPRELIESQSTEPSSNDTAIIASLMESRQQLFETTPQLQVSEVCDSHRQVSQIDVENEIF